MAQAEKDLQHFVVTKELQSQIFYSEKYFDGVRALRFCHIYPYRATRGLCDLDHFCMLLIQRA